MKVALDARWIFPEISGIGAYTQELIAQFARLPAGPEFVLLFNDRAVMERTLAGVAPAAPGRVQPHLLGYSPFAPSGQWRLPRLLRQLDVAVYHSPNYLVPLPAFPRGRRGRIACVITLHDLIPLLFPHFAPRSKKTRVYPLFRRLLFAIAARADAILTDSEHSRQDVRRGLDIAADDRRQVLAIPLGVHPRFTPGPAATQRRPVILYVGRRDPYKNLAGLVQALAAVVRAVPAARLEVIGPPDARYPEPELLARELGLADRVTWRGYVTEADLVAAYQAAAVLALPSRYEGFGLPALEAMACGTPVVCSNAGSLPEVAGPAALQVAPDDLAGLAAALVRVLTDPALAADLAAQGQVQAARYTWADTARRTLAVYESLAAPERA